MSIIDEGSGVGAVLPVARSELKSRNWLRKNISITTLTFRQLGKGGTICQNYKHCGTNTTHFPAITYINSAAFRLQFYNISISQCLFQASIKVVVPEGQGVNQGVVEESGVEGARQVEDVNFNYI